MQNVLVGPKRLFKEHLYSRLPRPMAFLDGATIPLVLFFLHKWFSCFISDLLNAVIFSTLSRFVGNLKHGLDFYPYRQFCHHVTTGSGTVSDCGRGIVIMY